MHTTLIFLFSHLMALFSLIFLLGWTPLMPKKMKRSGRRKWGIICYWNNYQHRYPSNIWISQLIHKSKLRACFSSTLVFKLFFSHYHLLFLLLVSHAHINQLRIYAYSNWRPRKLCRSPQQQSRILEKCLITSKWGPASRAAKATMRRIFEIKFHSFRFLLLFKTT